MEPRFWLNLQSEYDIRVADQELRARLSPRIRVFHACRGVSVGFRGFARPGNDLKEYDGAWHVRINDPWRLTFKWVRAAPMTCASKTPTDPGPTGFRTLNSNGVHHVQERYASCPSR